MEAKVKEESFIVKSKERKITDTESTFINTLKCIETVSIDGIDIVDEQFYFFTSSSILKHDDASEINKDAPKATKIKPSMFNIRENTYVRKDDAGEIMYDEVNGDALYTSSKWFDGVKK